MTRINCVPVTELSRQHLIAEYRELPRIFGLVEKAIQRGEFPYDNRNPKIYTLGTGHCRFFYDKLEYLNNRHVELVLEMQNRDYRPNFTKSLKESYIQIPSKWWNNWEPNKAALDINRKRIEERNKKLTF